jgi:hypothetical protein
MPPKRLKVNTGKLLHSPTKPSSHAECVMLYVIHANATFCIQVPVKETS